MEEVYFYLKSLTDPVVILLLLTGTALCILRSRRKERPRSFGWWILFVSFVMLYLLSIRPVVLSIAYVLEKDYLSYDINIGSEVDVVVILGAGILKRGLLSEYDLSGEASSRLLFGLQMAKRLNPEFIVLSGRGHRGIAEAKVMADVFRKLGVDESKIIIEAMSDNTKEHAAELDKILKDKEMKVGIVTSALHMKRSVKAFGKHFSDIVPLPSSYLYSPKRLSIKSFVPNSHNLYLSSNILHEIIGLGWYSIRG